MTRYALKPIKKILKIYYDGEISDEAVIYIRDILLYITHFIGKEGVEEFKNNNIARTKQGLPPYKRLDVTAFKEVWGRFFKFLNDSKFGKVGQFNDELLCQDGDIIDRTRKDIIIKDEATEAAKDDQSEKYD